MASSHEVKAVNRIATLMRNHPALFKGRPFEISGPFLGAGWLSIADRLCADLEGLLRDQAQRFRAVQAKDKWGSWRFYWRLEAAPGEDPDMDSPFVADLIGMHIGSTEAPEPGEEVSATPAGVRFQLLPSDELRRALNRRVRQAEQETERTCMWCGQVGAHWTTGWVHVACERHKRNGAVTLEEAHRLMEERRAARKGGSDGK